MPNPTQVKPLLMDALPWPVWKHVVHPLWVRWYEHWLRSPAWKDGRYRVGDAVRWRGAWLICCTDHYAGDQAKHPWDPGWGWDTARANALWEPRRLRDRLLLELVGDPRRDVAGETAVRAGGDGA